MVSHRLQKWFRVHIHFWSPYGPYDLWTWFWCPKGPPGRRGTSGRDRLSLPSKFYLVVRDRAGRVYQNPVPVHSQFSAVKAICYSGGSWGDSMFVGVPTLREGQIAALAAGFGWPSQVH